MQKLQRSEAKNRGLLVSKVMQAGTDDDCWGCWCRVWRLERAESGNEEVEAGVGVSGA